MTTFKETVGELIFASILPHNVDEITLMMYTVPHYLAESKMEVVTFSHKNELANSIFKCCYTRQGRMSRA